MFFWDGFGTFSWMHSLCSIHFAQFFPDNTPRFVFKRIVINKLSYSLLAIKAKSQKSKIWSVQTSVTVTCRSSKNCQCVFSSLATDQTRVFFRPAPSKHHLCKFPTFSATWGSDQGWPMLMIIAFYHCFFVARNYVGSYNDLTPPEPDENGDIFSIYKNQNTTISQFPKIHSGSMHFLPV